MQNRNVVQARKCVEDKPRTHLGKLGEDKDGFLRCEAHPRKCTENSTGTHEGSLVKYDEGIRCEAHKPVLVVEPSPSVTEDEPLDLVKEMIETARQAYEGPSPQPLRRRKNNKQRGRNRQQRQGSKGPGRYK